MTEGRLNAHNQRTKDLRRRKGNRLSGSYVTRNMEGGVQFENIDTATVEKVKAEIQKKAKRKRRIEAVFLVVSIGIAILIFIVFTQKYD